MLFGNARNAKKKNDLHFSNNVSQKKGLANFLQIDCSNSDCNFVYTTSGLTGLRDTKNSLTFPGFPDQNFKNSLTYFRIKCDKGNKIGN